MNDTQPDILTFNDGTVWPWTPVDDCVKQYAQDCKVCRKTKGRPVGMYDCKFIHYSDEDTRRLEELKRRLELEKEPGKAEEILDKIDKIGTPCEGYGNPGTPGTTNNWETVTKYCDLRLISWGYGPKGNYDTNPLFIATAKYEKNAWLMFADVLNLSICHFLIIPCINPIHIERDGLQNIAALLTKPHGQQYLQQMRYFRDVVYGHIFGIKQPPMDDRMPCTIRFCQNFKANIAKFRKQEDYFPSNIFHGKDVVDDLVMSGFNMPGSEELVHMQNVVLPWMWSAEIRKWKKNLHFATPRFIPLDILLDVQTPLKFDPTKKCVIQVNKYHNYDANDSALWVALALKNKNMSASSFMIATKNGGHTMVSRGELVNDYMKTQQDGINTKRANNTTPECMASLSNKFQGMTPGVNNGDHPVQQLCQRGFINPSLLFSHDCKGPQYLNHNEFKSYYVVKCAGKGNVPTGDILKDLQDHVNESAQTIYTRITEACPSSQKILLVFDGDKYQDDSPFTHIIAKLGEKPNVFTCIFKKRDVWNEFDSGKIPLPPHKGERICKTWETDGQSKIDYYYLVESGQEEKDYTLHFAQMCWFYGVSDSLLQSKMTPTQVEFFKDNHYDELGRTVISQDDLLDSTGRKVTSQNDQEIYVYSTTYQQKSELDQSKQWIKTKDTDKYKIYEKKQ